MFTTAGFTNIKPTVNHQAPGLDIHEMGGARMGHDPKTSILNSWNQVHACKNVFVTDGAWHDLDIMPEPVAYVYGIYRPFGRLRDGAK